MKYCSLNRWSLQFTDWAWSRSMKQFSLWLLSVFSLYLYQSRSSYLQVSSSIKASAITYKQLPKYIFKPRSCWQRENCHLSLNKRFSRNLDQQIFSHDLDNKPLDLSLSALPHQRPHLTHEQVSISSLTLQLGSFIVFGDQKKPTK